MSKPEDREPKVASGLQALRATETEPLVNKLQERWWRGTMIGAAVLIAALVAVGVVVLGGSGGDHGGRATGSSASASPVDPAPAEPGVFGKPSMPGTDPADAWQGAKSIDSVTPASFKAALGDKWAMDFRTRRLLGGIMETGLGGDESRKERRFDAIIKYSEPDVVFQVACQVGGATATPTDDTSLGFIEQCLATTVHGEEWTTLKAWLDQNLRTMAEGVTSTWFELPSVHMYVESNRHIISCTLTNI